MSAARDPLAGHPGHLDATQQQALTQFRSVLESQNLIPTNPADERINPGPGYDRFTDQHLLRFLRARKFDVERARVMWEGCEKWRSEFHADDVARNFEYPEQREVDKYYPQFYHKMDKDGRPIYIERLGKLDVGKLYALTTQERQLQHLVSEYEKFLRDRLPACSDASGHLVETSCTIMDLHNVGLSSFYRVKDYVSAASAIGQNYYPETMGKFYIINAPYLFSTVWSLIKPWLDEVTVSKISILGKNYQSELLKQIPAENLPTDFGGKCACAGGCSLSDAGPWNPKQF
ncbi:cytosolic factor, phosphatidylinositol/phosphatidylcholine transfer protein [Naganishia albida]|nr:cytosolic factor, phosphatidylinositol/phosphatidylcholine transfer protein [Naganishia albida]